MHPLRRSSHYQTRLGLTAALVAAALPSAAANSAAAKRPFPNIVVILADDK